MRISDWSSDVCSSDLRHAEEQQYRQIFRQIDQRDSRLLDVLGGLLGGCFGGGKPRRQAKKSGNRPRCSYRSAEATSLWSLLRSEEHTSELQSLMRISYAVFCLKNKK